MFYQHFRNWSIRKHNLAEEILLFETETPIVLRICYRFQVIKDSSIWQLQKSLLSKIILCGKIKTDFLLVIRCPLATVFDLLTKIRDVLSRRTLFNYKARSWLPITTNHFRVIRDFPLANDVTDRNWCHQTIPRLRFPIGVQYVFRGYYLPFLSYKRFFQLSTMAIYRFRSPGGNRSEVTSPIDSVTWFPTAFNIHFLFFMHYFKIMRIFIDCSYWRFVDLGR